MSERNLENESSEEKKISRNSQYVRGNVYWPKDDEANKRMSFKVKVQNVNKKDDNGKRIPNVKDTFVDVFVTGKKYDQLKEEGLEKGDFVEITGKASFGTFKPKGVEKTSQNNVIYPSSVKKVQFEEGKSNDFKNYHPNSIELKGNLTKDPEVFDLKGKTEEGEQKRGVRVGLAISDNYKKKGTDEWVERKPIYTEVVSFDKGTVEKVAAMKKGDAVELRGGVTHNSKPIEGTDKTQKFVSVISSDINYDEKTMARRKDAAAAKNNKKGDEMYQSPEVGKKLADKKDPLFDKNGDTVVNDKKKPSVKEQKAKRDKLQGGEGPKVVTAEKKKRGRPAGSKNKPKPKAKGM